MSALRDQHGRLIEYLRISVTDRCNLRCSYCMPVEGLPWLRREELLSDDEIIEVVRQLAPLGLRRIRITGGEPTLRPALPALIAGIREIGQVDDIALSTNGVRLPAMAAELRAAGLHRVNVSADSLRPERVRAIARRSIEFSPLLAAEHALAVGLDPVKVNVVLLRGTNDDEIEDFARLTIDRALHVRFIELMPVGELGEASPDHIVPSDEVLARVAALGPLTPAIGPERGNGPARYYKLAGAAGTIGTITPMTHTYCGSCNRVRLTADGRLRTCLFGEHEVDLRTPLRAGLPLEPFFRQALADKPLEHELLQMRVGGLRALSQVGG
ncbi:GTP 3',8-cyclase MoaA [soil metagenome]